MQAVAASGKSCCTDVLLPWSQGRGSRVHEAVKRHIFVDGPGLQKNPMGCVDLEVSVRVRKVKVLPILGNRTIPTQKEQHKGNSMMGIWFLTESLVPDMGFSHPIQHYENVYTMCDQSVEIRATHL